MSEPKKPTHIPKEIEINGKKKVVYVRTSETEEEMDRIRMGPFSRLDPLNIPELTERLPVRNLIIQAPYITAKRVIRTRLGVDKRTHRVLTGTNLLQSYFANEGYKDGFPVYKQFYLLFGYSESTNRRLHEIIVETLFTRYHNDDHFWVLIPKSLEEMIVQWGEALTNLRIFPYIRCVPSQEEKGPVSAANPTVSPAVGNPAPLRRVVDPSYPEEPDEFDAPKEEEDPKFRSRKKGGRRYS
jgi:hypothetical protein